MDHLYSPLFPALRAMLRQHPQPQLGLATCCAFALPAPKFGRGKSASCDGVISARLFHFVNLPSSNVRGVIELGVDVPRAFQCREGGREGHRSQLYIWTQSF